MGALCAAGITSIYVFLRQKYFLASGKYLSYEYTTPGALRVILLRKIPFTYTKDFVFSSPSRLSISLYVGTFIAGFPRPSFIFPLLFPHIRPGAKHHFIQSISLSSLRLDDILFLPTSHANELSGAGGGAL